MTDNKDKMDVLDLIEFNEELDSYDQNEIPNFLQKKAAHNIDNLNSWKELQDYLPDAQYNQIVNLWNELITDPENEFRIDNWYTFQGILKGYGHLFLKNKNWVKKELEFAKIVNNIISTAGSNPINKPKKLSNIDLVQNNSSDDFYLKLLSELGAPASEQNLRFLYAWRIAEGGSAAYNPFNTTYKTENCSIYNNSSHGVKNYPTESEGLNATVKTLTNGKYNEIVNGLKNDIGAEQIAASDQLKTWGTGELVLKVLKGRKTLIPPPIGIFAGDNMRASQKIEGVGGIREKILRIAESKLGTPYVWGAEDGSGFDCSGFVYWVFKKAGISDSKAPRGDSRYYANIGKHISEAEAQQGDLIAFSKNGRVNHIGIYTGNNDIYIGANGGGKNVVGNNPNAKIKYSSYKRDKRDKIFVSIENLIR